MANAKIWNDNIYPHREMYKGDWIEIPAGGFISMDWDEAKQFEGQFFAMHKNADGLTQDPKSFKKIRLELCDGAVIAPVQLVCHATGKIAKDANDLKAMNAEHEGLLDEESKKQVDEIKAKDAEIEALKAELASAKVKRGGRPKKDPQPEGAEANGL